jgi:hypothetical protein
MDIFESEEEVPKKRSKEFTEPFSCKVTPKIKSLEAELDALGGDSSGVARKSLEVGFQNAIRLLKEKAATA